MRPTSGLVPLLLAAALSMRAAPVPAAETARLAILHTTDLHGSLLPFDDLADRPAARGLVRVASMVKAVRASGVPVLLLDAGDVIEGSPLESVYQHGDRALPDPMMSAMNAMGYDAMAVGNHEFTFGPEAIARARRDARFPWLAANVVRASDGAPAFGTSIVKTLAGVRVGVVGLCTPAVPAFEDSAHYAGVRFLSPVDAARREVERLRAGEHCDLVVVVAHTGLERDPVTGVERPGDTPDENWGWRLAKEVPGIDVLILGHTHVVIPSLEIGGALVTQAGRWGERLGRVDLELTRATPQERWAVASRHAAVASVTDSVTDDPTLAALAAPYGATTRAALDRVIGEAATDLGSPHGALAPGAIWTLIHDAQRDATGADVSLASLPNPTARIRRGPVTVRDVMRLYPYDNTLGVVEMTGADLQATLERSARYFATYTFEADRPIAEPGMPAYNFDTAAGVTYDVDLTRPPGERILHLSLGGQPLDPARRLKVAVNSYRMHGGGGFDAVSHATPLPGGGREVQSVLVDWITAKRTLEDRNDSGWTLLPDYAGSPERPLIDLMVRREVAPRAELVRLGPDEPARRGDLAYWIARAYGWREKKLSSAFADVPDSLEPWIDGLLKRKVLGEQATHEFIQPFGVVTLRTALDWSESAARYAHYALPSKLGNPSFRRGLLAGIDLVMDSLATGSRGVDQPLTRAQMLGVVANLRYPQIRVLETTDFHGAILPGARERRTNRALGGSAVLAAHIARLRAANPEGTVLVDGGDLFQGTMISNLQFGRPVVEQMNLLGYAASVVGNHEFDWTADTLARRVHEMHFAALGANMVVRRTGRLPSWARADTVVTRRGVRIGILGLCYVNTPSVTLPANVAHLEFRDDSATAARRVPILRRKGRAEVVIGVGHIPAESDSGRHARSGDLLRLARGVRGVDAWFGGHSHNQILDEANGVPFMIAGAHGQVVGVCDLVVDPVNDRVVEHHARLVQTYADEVTPDSTVQALVEHWNRNVGPSASVPVGRNARTLLRAGPESTVGSLVADAMREAANADVAMQNTGGLRADLPEGVVTRGAIYEVMPFDNTLVTMRLTGAEVRLAIEQGLRNGRVTQVSGVRFAFDPSRPEMQRVVELTLADGSSLEDGRTYVVACNNFMATGGDNYDVLSTGRDLKDTGVVIREVLEARVAHLSKDGGQVDYRPEGRERRIP